MGGFLAALQRRSPGRPARCWATWVLRGLPTVRERMRPRQSGPDEDIDLDDADWTSELETGNQDDGIRFGKRELRPHPLAKRVKLAAERPARRGP
ncbi:hypothetical protein SMICM304S_06794 [Streptomyces microflavus]